MAKILIIDDDPAVLKMVSTALASAGHETLQATAAYLGMEQARSQSPELIICDIVMPQMDGGAFLAWMRNDPLTAGIPIILMTGYADQMSPRAGMNLGADDYLPKPFPIAELLAAVQARLRKQWALQRATQRKVAELSANLCSTMPSEFLTPLSDIFSRVELLKQCPEAEGNGELLDSFGGIAQSATGLYYSIQGYLFYSEVELLATRAGPLARARLSVTRSADHVVAAWAVSVAGRLSRGADLVLEAEGCTAPMDTTFLARATEILAGQAFLCSAPATPVRVTVERKGEAFCLTIQDRGKRGRFAEWNPTAAKAVGSSSEAGAESCLGMTTVRRLAELHGGTLDICSGNFAGTVVTFRLPMTN